ncbi:MAG: hypothetical protein IPH57_05065 [Saprospiraceae bacterium]|nr:hypothetical protein [Saprospiraceae bacterium]
MNKTVLILIIIFMLSGKTLCQSNDVGNRWVISLDLPFSIAVYNQQFDFFDKKVQVIKDYTSYFGFESLKYYPNKNRFKYVDIGVGNRNVFLQSSPNIHYKENYIRINNTYNFCFANKKPVFEELTRSFLGIGLSYSYDFGKDLNFGSVNQNFPKLVNTHKVYGLLSLGILEDIFNVPELTSLSKFSVLLRIPLFDFGNNFSNKYLNLPSEISEFQKSKSRNIGLEISYNHLIDNKRNTYQQKYMIDYDQKWPAVDDNFKNLFPPIINNKLPTRDFSGNFYYEFLILNTLDSIFSEDLDLNCHVTNKRFNGFAFGYTINLFGNYRKDYLEDHTGLRLYNVGDKSWRRNFFISVGYLNNIVESERFNYAFKVFNNSIVLGGGLKIKKLNGLRFDMAFGGDYRKPIFAKTYLNMQSVSAFNLNNSSYFIGFGLNNYILKLSLSARNFKEIDLLHGFNLSFNVGI